MTRSLWARMVALLVVLAASFYYIAFDVAGWRIGAQDYRVTVMLKKGGGIYTEAYATYRGVTVGRVVRLELLGGHVGAVVAIRPGVRIPADTTASVRELTAAGEQYLDFVPRAGHGPYLHAGSVVPLADTNEPLQIATVLGNTASLLRSIDPQQLTTVTKAFGAGFDGTAADLRNIVVAGQALFDALDSASSATIELITNGHTVLEGAKATDPAFGRFAASLDKLSAQLRASNSDVKALLVNSGAASRQGERFLDQSSRSLRSLIDASGTVSAVALSEEPELKALFEVLPVFAGRIGTVVHDGSLHVELDYNTDDPVCPYIPASQTALPTQKTGAPALDRTCTLSTPGALARGAG